jgi:outer membrane immunogenic protein
LHNENHFLDCRSLDGRCDHSLRGGFSGGAGQAPLPAKRRCRPRRPLPVSVIFAWTGCYIGVEGGGNWGGSSQIAHSGPNTNQPITGNFDLSGGIAGGTAGCNLQVSDFVIGAENDFSWTNKSGSALDQPPFLAGTTSSTREKWIDTFRGRFGYAIDRFMV